MSGDITHRYHSFEWPVEIKTRRILSHFLGKSTIFLRHTRDYSTVRLCARLAHHPIRVKRGGPRCVQIHGKLFFQQVFSIHFIHKTRFSLYYSSRKIFFTSNLVAPFQRKGVRGATEKASRRRPPAVPGTCVVCSSLLARLASADWSRLVPASAPLTYYGITRLWLCSDMKEKRYFLLRCYMRGQ